MLGFATLDNLDYQPEEVDAAREASTKVYLLDVRS